MKKIVCGIFGTIYYAKILKNGLISDTNRENVTDDALFAVLQHIMCMDEYKKRDGFSGYEYEVCGKRINLIAYDKSKYKLIKKENGDNHNGET